MSSGNYQQDWMIRSTVTYDELTPPENIQISESNSEINLSWSKSPGAVSYKVSSGLESVNVSTLEESGIADTFWVDTEIVNDKKFYNIVASTSPSGQTRDIGMLSANSSQPNKLNSGTVEIVSSGDVGESISFVENQENSKKSKKKMVLRQKKILDKMDSQTDTENVSEKEKVIGVADNSIIENPKVEIKKYFRN